MLDLAGCWTLSDESGAQFVSFDLPGDGVSAPARAGVSPDHSRGRNDHDCRWVCERDRVARRSFVHDGAAAELVVEGLGTLAELRRNGVTVLSAANMHRRWRVDGSAALKAGENAVEIHFRSPARETLAQAVRSCAPLIVAVVPKDGDLDLRAVNDRTEARTITVKANAAAMDGSTRALGETVAVRRDAAAPVLTLAANSLGPGKVPAFTRSSIAQGGDIHAPKPWKAHDLLPSGLTADDRRDSDIWKLTFQANALVPFVSVESEVPGRFSTNAVTMYPGYPTPTTFTPEDPSAVPVFTLRYLHSATCGG